MMIELSICIATLNRSRYISETLNSILDQLEPSVELIVVDGASSDNTPEILADYQLRYPEIRYFREPKNSGVDCDYDKAVGYARGKYCWLMSDDDLLKPGAIKILLEAFKQNFSYIFVDAEVRSSDFSKLLLKNRFLLDKDRIYKPKAYRELFIDTAKQLSFIGSVVIKRAIWMERNRQSYYGSFFIHVGVIFQALPPENVLVIAEPQVIIRYSNASWTSRTFEIWMFKWPQIIWSLKLFLDVDKKKIVLAEPWRNFKNLMLLRAMGNYTFIEYKKKLKYRVNGKMESLFLRVLSVVPGKLVNLICFLYTIIFSKAKTFTLTDLRSSPFYFMGQAKASKHK